MKRLTYLLIGWLLVSTLVYARTSHKPKKLLKVAVVDSGLDLTDPRFKDHLCSTGHKDFTGEGIRDTYFHGSHVTGLIIEYAGDANYCLMIYKYYSSLANGHENLKREIEAFREAVKNHADIVNFSGGGAVFDEQESIVIMENPKTVFVTAAGNDGKDLDAKNNSYFPASLFYKNMRVVGGLDINDKRVTSSNYGRRIKYWELGENVISTTPCVSNSNSERPICGEHMTGTSQATAIFTGKLIRKMNAK